MIRPMKIALGMVITAFLAALILPRFFGPGVDSWNNKELTILNSLQLAKLPPVPRDPSNAYENNPAAIALGKRLFADVRFSKNKAVSCAHCHDPARQFQDDRPISQGIGAGARRAMPLVGSGYNTWQFWDGRKDSLWAQAIGSLETAMSHGSNRLAVAHLMEAHYRKEYESVFGPLPPLAHLGQDATPLGNSIEKASWDSFKPETRESVSRVFVNMGKALAAYQKTLQFGESPLDRYIAALEKKDDAGMKVLSDAQKRGLRTFIGPGQCISCHNGPLLTDQAFHNIGVPNAKNAKPDPGRAAGLVKVDQDEFNCLGRFSDAKPEQCAELQFMNRDKTQHLGSFKTPGLRNVALRPPYMHAGQFASLKAVIEHYVKAPPAVVGHNERDPVMLNEQEISDLIEFLKSLSGTIAEKKPV